MFEHDEVLDAAIWAELAYRSQEYVDACWDDRRPDDPNVLTRHVGLVRSAATKPVCFSDTKTDCQGLVARLPLQNTAVVALRGTSSLADVVADCNVRLVPYGEGRVHAGFLDQATGVRDAVRLLLKDWLGEVRLVGHSLGTGVAAILALDAATERKDDAASPVSYVGFGTPRVGDAGWKAGFESLVTRALRVKNGRDPVSSVPYSTKALPYVEVGEYKHVGRQDPCPDKADLADIADHDVTTGYVAHCTQDAPSTVGFVPYVLGFLMNRLHRASVG